MERIKFVMDRSGVIDGEVTLPEVIIKALEQSKDEYIPLAIGHDIRKCPIGRSYASSIEILDDGTYLLHGEAEIFEESDDFDAISKSGRVVKIRAKSIDTFTALGNQTFEEDEDVAALYEELRELGCGDRNQAYRENSIEPMSLLIIGFGVFAAQGISNGFFSKLGEDLYELLKLKLKKIFEKKSSDRKDNLLQFQFFVNTNTGKTVEINVVITNPSQEVLDNFFDSVPTIVEKTLSKIPLENLDLCRIVFSYESMQLKLLYALRLDGVPVNLIFGEKR